MLNNWEPSGEQCPHCQKETEILWHDGLDCAERCTNCGWQVDFEDGDDYDYYDD